MHRLPLFLKGHVFALLLAVGAGLLSGLPQHLASTALGDDFRGIPFLFQDNEAVYLTRMHEFKDGFSGVTSPFLHEYKQGGPTLLLPIEEYVYWALSGFGVLPLTQIVVWSKYVFPFLLFLLLYALTILLIPRDREVRQVSALAVASLGVLGHDLIHVSEVLKVFQGTYADVYLSLWTRLVHPVIGALFLFSFLVALRLVLLGRHLFVPLAGILLALMTGYIFSFALALVVTALYAGIALVFYERKMGLQLAAVLLIAFVLVLPHLVSVSPFLFGSDTSVALKNGLFLTHMPLLSTTLLLVSGVVGLYACLLFWKGNRPSLASPLVFVGVLLGACMIAMNQQVVTGKTIWPQHFVQYTIPLGYLALLVVYAHGTTFFQGKVVKKLLFILPLIGIGLSFLLGVVALNTYTYRLADFAEIQRWAPALSYLAHEPYPCVVLPIEETERINPYLTAFTGCDTYFTHYVFVGVPDERIMHNFLVYLRVAGVTPDTVSLYLDQHEERVWAVFFRDWKDIFQRSTDPWLLSISDRPEIATWLRDMKGEIESRYQEFYMRDFREVLLEYVVTHVIYDTTRDPAFPMPAYPFLEKVFDQEGVSVYRVR